MNLFGGREWTFLKGVCGPLEGVSGPLEGVSEPFGVRKWTFFWRELVDLLEGVSGPLGGS